MTPKAGQETPVIWWIRRDLRLADNYALVAALATKRPVLPVFILDPEFDRHKGKRRMAFYLEAVDSLRKDLSERGSGMVVRHGTPIEALTRLCREVNATQIFAEKDHSPLATTRDLAVAENLPLTLVDGQLVLLPKDVHKADGTPYTVFTPFSKKWLSLVPRKITCLQAPEYMPAINLPESDPLPLPLNGTEFVANEAEAQKRLATFAREKIFYYHELRNRMDLDNTSMLSPYLRFGLLSHRQVLKATQIALDSIWSQAVNFPSGLLDKGPETFLNELIWREFYVHILVNFPRVLHEEFDLGYKKIAWRYDHGDLQAWKEGKTGYPIVDAAMRQLNQTGWMHNRARMISASFLVKDLLIDWREGERWFSEQLVDADPAVNNGGWQWVAGTGTDAAPYFRVFNPVLQAEKFDPNGDYVRKWVPELRGFSSDRIHKPWLADMFQQNNAKCLVGVDYPYPIIDHAFARERTLRAYKTAKENA